MVSSSTVMLVQAVLLLALVATGSLAATNDSKPKSCDFNYSQSLWGDTIRIQVGDNLAMVQGDNIFQYSWTGFVRNSDDVVYSDHTGTSIAAKYSNLPAKNKTLIDELSVKNMTGLNIVGSGDHIFADPSDASLTVTRLVPFPVRLGTNLAYKFSRSASKTKLIWKIVYARGTGSEFTHMFYLQNLAVIMVDDMCQKVKITENKSLNFEIQEFLREAMQKDSE